MNKLLSKNYKPKDQNGINFNLYLSFKSAFVLFYRVARQAGGGILLYPEIEKLFSGD